jgi:gluconate 2-dehydrogenase alpha chain
MSKTPEHPLGGRSLNRRQLLGNSLKVGTVALIPLVNTGCTTTEPPAATATVLGAANDSILTAFVDRIFPADELGPAASAAGAVRYINRSLAQWNQRELPELSAGLQALDKAALTRHALGFAALTAAQQDELMTALEAAQLPEVAAGTALFNRLYRLTLEGLFSDPYYGGNVGYVGWDLIGYPGAVMASTPEMQKMGQRLPALHTSAHGAEHDGH